MCNLFVDATADPTEPALFTTAATGESVTAYCKHHKGRWLGDPCEEQDIIVADTPGLDDSQGRDARFMTEINNFILTELGRVDYVLLCVNGQQPRLDKAL